MAIEELIIAFAVPAITAMVIFVSQWHKKGSVIEISSNDIRLVKNKMDEIESKLDKISEKINILNTDTKIFRYRLKTMEKLMDEFGAHRSGGYTRQPFRPKDSNGE